MAEQLPVITRGLRGRFGDNTAAEIVREMCCASAIPRGTAALRSDAQGYEGEVLGRGGTPLPHARRAVDALYFLLYGGRDARVMGSFPITRRNDERDTLALRDQDLILTT